MSDLADIVERALRRGMCSPKQHAEKGCQVCDDAEAAIKAVRERLSLPVLTCGRCSELEWNAAGRVFLCGLAPTAEGFDPRVDPRGVPGTAPAWCPRRGEP